MKVLRTALLPPRMGAGIVSRPRLINQFAAFGQRRLAVVQAPAGFGKTTVLQQWQATLATAGELTAWLSLDQHVSNIMGYVMSAFSEGIPAFRERLASCFEATGFVTTGSELAAVVECLSEIDRTVVLFIDDAHLLPPEEMRVFGRLIERLPSCAYVVIGTRELPGLPLARIRARGALLEVDMNDLRFTPEEARQLLAASSQGDLSDAELEDLVTRTEGWAAGLRLASLTMAREGNTAKLIASFWGGKSVIADFFSEDVFGSQPLDVQSFLLGTCLLGRFTADLCNAVTGRTDSRNMLDRVETSGLFLIRLDDGSWYRYHGLFADYLSRRLADLDRAAIARIHLAASRWFHENDLDVEALDHAVRSTDQTWLAELLEETAEELVYNGKLSFVVGLAEQLHQNVMLRYPKILLAIAWLRVRNLRVAEARQHIVWAERRIAELRAAGLPDDEHTALRQMVTHREMMLAAAEDDFSKTEDLAAALLRETDGSKPYITCTLYGQTIRAQREQFKFSQFEKYEAKARATLEKSTYKFAFVAQQAIVGTTLFYMGMNDSAERALEYGIGQAIDFSGENSPLAALPALPLAEVLYDRDDRAGATELVKNYLPMVREYGFADEIMAGYLLAPRLHLAKGDVAGAFRALDDARSVSLELGLDRLAVGVLAARIRLLLRTGHVERALELGRIAGAYSDARAIGPQIDSTTRDEMLAVVWTRLAISQGDVGEALGLAQRWKQFCAHRGAVRHLIGWNLLGAQLLLINGDFRAAQRSLREALVLAAEGGQRRLFLDEGVMIHELLAESYGRGPLTKHPADIFAYDLLSALESRPKAHFSEDVEPRLEGDGGIDGKMTGRELEILNFVASGLRNREIGDRLGLTEGSVKWYMQRIYDKVGTRRRSVAVERARQFGLLN